MEDRRIDPLQIIGMLLIFGIFTWMMYNQPVPDLETTVNDMAAVEQQESVQVLATDTAEQDAYEAAAVSVVADTLSLQNDVLSIDISTKGGVMTGVALKDLVNYQENPLYLINNDNSSLNIAFTTVLGQLFQTKFMMFTPSVSNTSAGQELRLRAPLDSNGFIELVYTLPKEGYRFGFEVIAEGIKGALDPTIPAAFSWRMDGFRHAKSAQYENRYTQLAYNHKADKYSTLSAAGDDDEDLKNVRWVSYRQHFFSSILIPENPFEVAAVMSSTITDEEEEESEFLKSFMTETTLPYSRNRFQANFDWYMGPTDYEVLKTYDESLYESISFGWGLIGWINRSVFYPLFSLLSGVVPQGIAIQIVCFSSQNAGTASRNNSLKRKI
jgi:YidC/Oxa1 family membrane protein insertase